MIVGLIFFIFIYCGVKDVTIKDLSNSESARGIITYLVAVTTIAMAAMLMLAAIMTGGRDLDKRFTLGKEILTTLIGVLGTIIGFYYGSTTKSDTNTGAATRDSTSITVNGLNTIPLSPQPDKPLNASAIITGGITPYDYILTISPTGTAEPRNATSQDGRINETITFMDSAKSGSITLTLSGKDAKNTPFSAVKIMDIK